MVLASIIAQDKEVKVIHVGKEINLSLFTNYMIFYVEIEWAKQGCTGRLEGHELIFFCKDTKIATSCWTTINRRMLEPTKKKISHVQRRSCNRGAIMLKSNPIPTRDFWKAKTKQNKTTCVHQDPGKVRVIPTRDWVWFACECLSVSCGEVGQQWPAMGRGALAASVLGGTAYWHKSSLKRSPLALP